MLQRAKLLQGRIINEVKELSHPPQCDAGFVPSRRRILAIVCCHRTSPRHVRQDVTSSARPPEYVKGNRPLVCRSLRVNRLPKVHAPEMRGGMPAAANLLDGRCGYWTGGGPSASPSCRRWPSR